MSETLSNWTDLMTDVTALTTTNVLPSRDPKDQAIWKVAQDLEATFLAEMLKSAGFGAARESFGGGVGGSGAAAGEGRDRPGGSCVQHFEGANR